MNNKFIFPILMLSGIGMGLASVGPSPKTTTHFDIRSKSNPAAFSGWCPSDSIRELFAWNDGRHKKLIRSCQKDSVDTEGIIAISRLEIQEIDILKSLQTTIAVDSVGPGLSSVRFYAPGASLVDIDGDDKMESFLPYYFAHDGADPTEIRAIVRRNGNSFVIRGRIPWLDVDAKSYRMEFDPSFKTQSRRFRLAADSLLRVFVHKLCNDSNTGATSYIPVELGGTKDDE